MVYAFNAFSIPVLYKTLFSPWKQDKDATGVGFTAFEKVVFYVFSRLMGFVVRTILIVTGLAFTFCVLLTFPVFFLIPFKISRESLGKLRNVGASLSYGDTYTLNTHGRDVVSPSEQQLYGKEKALRMIERGLSKNVNHNVLLVGDAGIGKSTLISYLGLLGQSGLSFSGIQHHRIVELFIEGISLPDFDRSLREAAKAGNIILVIKNIHMYESLYERLMPYLTMSHLGIIATTDFANYDHVLKNHQEFLSRFEKIDLTETNVEETVEILKNNAKLLKISIEEDALREIVRLADRLIGNQVEPAKSLAILNELQSLGRNVTILDVRQIVSDKTNMPVGDLGADEKKVLSELEDSMRKKIVGQDEAVKDVSEALRRLRTGIADHTKPAASLLFLGSTGVGKPYTAKVLSRIYRVTTHHPLTA